MKNKLIALFLVLTMSLSLAACGKKEEPKAPTEDEEVNETLPEEAPVEMPEEETEEPAEEETEEPAEPEQEEEAPAEKPQESKPVQKPAEKPAEKPAQSAPAASVDLSAFMENIAAGNENMPAMMQAEGEALDAFYPGLTAIKTKQCGVYMAMISAAVGEIALVEVENAADVQAVKDIFQARINYQVGDDSNPGGAWYPETIEGWKNNSRIVSNGSYVMMVALDGADDVVTKFNALFA